MKKDLASHEALMGKTKDGMCEYKNEEKLMKTLLKIGQVYYHIDEPNQPFEVVKQHGSCTYALLVHPSFHKSKLISEKDIGKTFFATREECLNARITRAERILENEKSFKERKI